VGEGRKMRIETKATDACRKLQFSFREFSPPFSFHFFGSPAISPFCSAAAVTKIQLKPLSLGGRGRGGGQGGQEGQDIGKTGIRTHPD